MNTDRIESIQKYGKKAKGKSELIKHFKDQRLSLRQSVYAHCYGCMGYYADGKVDCAMPHCPLHPFMPYNTNRVKKVSSRKMTDAQKEKMQAARL